MAPRFSTVHCNGSEQWFSVERRPRKKERKEAGLLGGGMVGWGASWVERAAQRAHHAGRRLKALVCTVGEFGCALGGPCAEYGPFIGLCEAAGPACRRVEVC